MTPTICMPEGNNPLIILNVTRQPDRVIPAASRKRLAALSLQLVGRPFGEAMLYRVAQFYKDTTGWTERHPPELSYGPRRKHTEADRANVVSEGV